MERNTELLLRVARMYHVQSETMDAIAHHLGVSRSTVSRLLKEARDRGLVRVTITDPDRPMTRLAEIFRKSFHVQAHLVNVRPGSSYMLRLEQVAKVAARLLVAFVLDSCAVQRGGKLSLGGQYESFVHVEGLGAGDEEDTFAAVAFNALHRVVGAHPGLVPGGSVDGAAA